MVRSLLRPAGLSAGKDDLAGQLAGFLRKWADGTRPIEPGDEIALHGLDTAPLAHGREDLFLTQRADHVKRLDGMPVAMSNLDVLDTDSLRNAFFPEPFIRHSHFDRLRLTLEGQGAFHLSAQAIGEDGQRRVLAEGGMKAGEERLVLELGQIERLPGGVRLVAQAQALAGKARLTALRWSAVAPARAEGRMVVLLRTFGRTRDICRLFDDFRAEAAGGAYGHVLRNTAFVILDASEGVARRDHAGLGAGRLFNLFSFRGANLGGGGNMSQVMLLVREALTAAGVAADELLLLDDDLEVSLESLRRNWAATLLRTDETMFTLPVLRRSDPRAMWEDGSFWGRFAGGSFTGRREVIRPHFLRHGFRFKKTRHLSEMAQAHYPEYSTFIFQSLPAALAARIGYPAAFFLRGDDIEYSLRARAAGAGVMSNPNLAAWHEPAHSYAGEYMAVAHGLIVNMCHGQTDPAPLAAFFMERAKAHIGVNDPRGLRLYARLLADFNGCETFLEPGFAATYRARLGAFRDFEAGFERLPDEIISAVIAETRDKGGRAARFPFLYMQPARPLKDGRHKRDGLEDACDDTPLTRVILDNPHTGTRRIYDPQTPENAREVVQAAAELYRQIDVLTQDFARIRDHYLTRMEAVSGPEFWQAELAGQDVSFAVLAREHRNV
ncbi:MAG: hypothetical protein ACLFQL_07495 [Paracoccaceae bacterium]